MNNRSPRFWLLCGTFLAGCVSAAAWAEDGGKYGYSPPDVATHFTGTVGIIKESAYAKRKRGQLRNPENVPYAAPTRERPLKPLRIVIPGRIAPRPKLAEAPRIPVNKPVEHALSAPAPKYQPAPVAKAAIITPQKPDKPVAEIARLPAPALAALAPAASSSDVKPVALYEAPPPKEKLAIDPALIASTEEKPVEPVMELAALPELEEEKAEEKKETLAAKIEQPPLALPEVHEAPPPKQKFVIPDTLFEAPKAAVTPPPVVAAPTLPLSEATTEEKQTVELPPAVLPEPVQAAVTPAPAIPEPKPVLAFEAPRKTDYQLKIDPVLLSDTTTVKKATEAVPLSTTSSVASAEPAMTPLPAEASTDNVVEKALQAFQNTVTQKSVTTTNTAGTQKKDFIPEVPVAELTTPAGKEEDDPLIVPTEGAMLTQESRDILEGLPKGIGTTAKKATPKPVKMDRARAVSDVFGTDEAKTHKSLGIDIEIKVPNLTSNELLEQAYNSLIAGNALESISAYQQVLQKEPDNKLALFGLATTYHRERQFDLARPLYGRLLKIDPYNVEALNNFMALVSEESPSEARDKLEQLQEQNPDFSPIPAQLAIVYEKMGDTPKAIEKMRDAIDISPENLTYRYNLAIMLDKSGNGAEAALIYRQLLDMEEKGEKIPGSRQQIQERLTFLGSNSRS